MIRASVEEIAERARRLGERLGALEGFSISLQDGESAAGGGSTPGQSLPTRLITVTHITRTAQELANALRKNRPPIIARIEEGRLVLDLRTVLSREQEEEIFKAFQRFSVNVA